MVTKIRKGVRVRIVERRFFLYIISEREAGGARAGHEKTQSEVKP
jgi:hypothetical protein